MTVRGTVRAANDRAPQRETESLHLLQRKMLPVANSSLSCCEATLHQRSDFIAEGFFMFPTGTLHSIKKHLRLQVLFYGVPDAIRTHGLQSRSLSLYPAELRAQMVLKFASIIPRWCFSCQVFFMGEKRKGLRFLGE